jgi:hypothetical protein
LGQKPPQISAPTFLEFKKINIGKLRPCKMNGFKDGLNPLLLNIQGFISFTLMKKAKLMEFQKHHI